MLRQRPDLAVAVERDHVEIGREVTIPGVVALAARHDRRRVGQPGDPVVLILPRRQVARRAGAVGGDDVDVLGAVEDPVLAVEPREEAFHLPRRLPADVLGFVALVAGAAGERDPAAVGRPLEIAEAVRHRAHGPRLARSGDREDVERRVTLLLAASRRERQELAVGRPLGVAVVRTGRDRGAVEPDPCVADVLLEVDGPHDEHDPRLRRGTGPAPRRRCVRRAVARQSRCGPPCEAIPNFQSRNRRDRPYS